MVTDIYQHPVVQKLRQENAALKRRNAQLEDLHTLALNRDLQARALEAVHPRSPGVFTPDDGAVFTIHVDNLRRRSNIVRKTREPLIRVLHKDDVWHCHALTGRSFTLAEDYDKPIPGKLAAVCVLQTADPIEVLR